VAVTSAPVRVPTQRPLVPRFTSENLKIIFTYNSENNNNLINYIYLPKKMIIKSKPNLINNDVDDAKA
jgi:hypothetical protein